MTEGRPGVISVKAIALAETGSQPLSCQSEHAIIFLCVNKGGTAKIILSSFG